jgi:hypothetical protein
LTTLFGSTAVPTIAVIETQAAPKKRGWLPLLTVLFLISYGLMTMLIVEQGQTIESQRVLIRELFRDSSELTAMKIKAQQAAQAAGQTQAPAARNQAPSSQAQSNQYPSTQAQNQSPSSQAAPQGRTQNQSQKQNPQPQYQMPERPASDLADDRRALKTI